MKVDKRLMLVTDMNPLETVECLRVAEKIVFEGVVDWNSPVIQVWMDAFAPNTDHRLLMASTALPQRLLISYINALEVRS